MLKQPALKLSGLHISVLYFFCSLFMYLCPCNVLAIRYYNVIVGPMKQR